MAYLIHYNKNHSKANGQFVSGDGDGDGVVNDHANRSKKTRVRIVNGKNVRTLYTNSKHLTTDDNNDHGIRKNEAATNANKKKFIISSAALIASVSAIAAGAIIYDKYKTEKEISSVRGKKLYDTTPIDRFTYDQFEPNRIKLNRNEPNRIKLNRNELNRAQSIKKTLDILDADSKDPPTYKYSIRFNG